MENLYLKKYDAFIRYSVTRSSGKTIVYLPGISFSVMASFFDVVTHEKMPAHRAILIDYFGSGASDQPDTFSYSMQDHASTVAAVLDDIGCTGTTVVGHSMGGTVAIELALARPDLVTELIVGEGNVTSGGGELSKQIAAHNKSEFISAFFPQMLRELHESAKKGEATGLRRGMVWKHASALGLHQNAHALVNVDDDLKEKFLNLQINRTFIYGEHSRPKGPDEVGPDTPLISELSARGVNTAIVPDAGHGQMFDNLDGFVEILAKFAV